MKKNINFIILLLLLILLKKINPNIFNNYNDILKYISIIIILVSSFYFVIKLNYKNYDVKKMNNIIRESNSSDLKALFMSLGAKIGVGSIAGISIAIYINGPGVLLWIWIITSLSSILTYCETFLGSKYQNGVFSYIKKGLNNRIALIYTMLLIFIYEIGFVGIQTNTIYKSLIEFNIINSKLTIIIILLIISLLIFNRLEKIITITSKIVPLMCLIYIIVSIPLLFKINIIRIIEIIIKDGINNNKLLKIITAGFYRGIFATESGIGTSSISSTISNNREKQAMVQLIGVHFISLIIISLTGIIVINYSNNYIGKINGIEILLNIYNNFYGLSGKIYINIIILLFAISTILCSYFYTIKAIEYIKNKITNIDIIIIKVVIIIFSFLGMVIKSSIIWSIIDNLIIYLLIINICAMIKLRKEIK